MPGAVRVKTSDNEKKSYQHRQERWVQKRKLRNETITKLAEKQTNEKQVKEIPDVKPKNQVTRSFSQSNRESISIKTTLADLSQRVTTLESEIKLLKTTSIEKPTTSPLDMFVNELINGKQKDHDDDRRNADRDDDRRSEARDDSRNDMLTESKEQCTPVDETPLNSNPDSDEEFVLAGTEIESRPKTKPPVKIV